MPTNTQRITALEQAVALLKTVDTGEAEAAKASNKFWSAFANKMNVRTNTEQVSICAALEALLDTL
jgi:hypothetical protein